MAKAVPCDSSSDGIQRRLLEASLEHSGETVHGGFGECAAHRKDPLPSLFFTSTFTGSSAVCGTPKLHWSKNPWRTSVDKDRICRKRLLAGIRYRGSIEWQPGPF